jgi:hypothetical protein
VKAFEVCPQEALKLLIIYGPATSAGIHRSNPEHLVHHNNQTRQLLVSVDVQAERPFQGSTAQRNQACRAAMHTGQ